jgi:hypothetical protein
MSGPRERRSRPIDFERVAAAALRQSDAVIRGLVPNGRREGAEWVFRPPWRESTGLGSCKVNLNTGSWGDFKVGDGGSDLVSLAARVSGLNQRDAAIRLAESLGVDPYRVTP